MAAEAEHRQGDQGLRSVLIRPGRELLSGQVEVDETHIDGEEAGLAGGRGKGKEALAAVGSGSHVSQGIWAMPDADHPRWLRHHADAFITDNVALGFTVITDGWRGYLGIEKVVGYKHDRYGQVAAKVWARTKQVAARWAPHRVPGQTVAAVYKPFDRRDSRNRR